MLCGPMYNILFISAANGTPGGPYRPRPRHVVIYHRLIMEIYEKKSSLQQHDTKLVYLIYKIVMWSST